MEMLSFVLTLGTFTLSAPLLLADLLGKYAVAYVLCVTAFMCVLATIVVDFVRNDYSPQGLQLFMLGGLGLYLVWRREYDPFRA